MKSHVTKYLQSYLESLTEQEKSQCTSLSADYFCADKENANLCARLIREGKKTATSSLKICYSLSAEELPQPGHLQVVTDWDGNPTSIIKTTQVTEKRFCDVDAAFAAAEGEGDRSLGWWQKSHWDFFAKECKELGVTPSWEMVLILEYFIVEYQ